MNKPNSFQAEAASSVGGQFALVDRSEGNPFWSDRATQTDLSVHLGEAMVLNSMVSNTPTGIASLVSPDQLKITSEWIRLTLSCESDEAFPGDPSSSYDPLPVLKPADLHQVFGLETGFLPKAYEDWRYSVELYFATDATLYMMRDSCVVRMRVLPADECSVKRSQTLPPFEEAPGDQTDRQLAIVVIVPNRMASLGGLRGYRTSFVHGGHALAALKNADKNKKWTWTTEFFDSTVNALFGIDGLERIVVGIGFRDVPINRRLY